MKINGKYFVQLYEIYVAFLVADHSDLEINH